MLKMLMREILLLATVLLALTFLTCGIATADDTSGNVSPSPPVSTKESDVSLVGDGMIKVDITIAGQIFAAVFYDNESSRAIVEKMPFTLNMNDYASQEKVVGLTFDLPVASTETPATISAGDIYLWSGDNLVIFYTTFPNSYNYTPVGYITNTEGLRAALGSGDATVAFAAVIAAIK